MPQYAGSPYETASPRMAGVLDRMRAARGQAPTLAELAADAPDVAATPLPPMPMPEGMPQPVLSSAESSAPMQPSSNRLDEMIRSGNIPYRDLPDELLTGLIQAGDERAGRELFNRMGSGRGQGRPSLADPFGGIRPQTPGPGAAGAPSVMADATQQPSKTSKINIPLAKTGRGMPAIDLRGGSRRPEDGRSRLDRGVSDPMFLAGASMMRYGAQPGATLGGGIGEGLMAFATGRQKAEDRDILRRREGRADSREERLVAASEARLLVDAVKAGRVTAQSVAGKLAADRDAGLIDDNTYRSEIKRLQRAKAPQVQTIYDEETGRLQKVQFDEETGEWEPIGGARSPTGRERGLTLAQEALNEERDVMRDEVRSVLDELPPGVSLMDEAVRRSKKESATGRENPDYDGGELLKSIRGARRSKYGDDPEHEKFVASLREKRRPPEQAGGGQPQPAAQPPAGDQGGGFTDWVRRQFTGSEPAASPGGQNGAALMQQAQEAIARGADPAAVAARLRQRGIDPSGLR